MIYQDLGAEAQGQPQKDIETIASSGKTLALIIRATHTPEGISFVTPPDFSQQVAQMRHPSGYVILPHVHNPVYREVRLTQEVLMVRRGRLRVDLYTEEQEYVVSRVLTAGDVILLASGGHGFEMLEETEMIEVKQGPYAGEGDKTRFQPSNPDQIGKKYGNTPEDLI